MEVYQGKSVFGGIAIGRISVHKKDEQQVKRVKIQNSEREIERYRQAKQTAMEHYPTAWVEYLNVERVAGETNWSFWSLVHYALDGIVAYSVKPLEMLTAAGGVVSLCALLALVFVVVRAAIFGDPVAGWPSLMTVIILVGGLLTVGLGVIGYYLSKIYLEVKGRPVYLLKESSDRDWLR